MLGFATCLWFDNQAEQAVQFYSKIFKTQMGRTSRYSEAGAKVSGQRAGSVMAIDCKIEDHSLTALNAGPIFKTSPAYSFFVSCADEAEINKKWTLLSVDGQVRMGLDKYPWAERYGWVSDKFGVDWQLILAPRPQKIVPCLLFVNKLFGKGEEALKLYTSVFPNSKIESLTHDPKTNTVLHSSFMLDGQNFVLMEGAGQHEFEFTHGNSIMVYCDTQKEIDTCYDRLATGGAAEPCGWLQDKYGVSWQIAPRMMGQWMADPAKSEKVMNTMVTMKKLDLAKLEAAAR